MSRRGSWRSFIVFAGVAISTGGTFWANLIVPRVLDVQATAAFFVTSSTVLILAAFLRSGMDIAIVKEIATARANDDLTAVRRTAYAALLIAAVYVIAGVTLGPPAWSVAGRLLYPSSTVEQIAIPAAIWLASESTRRVLSEALRGMNHVVAATLCGDPLRSAALASTLTSCFFISNVTIEKAVWLGAAPSVLALAAASTVLIVRLRTQGSHQGTDLGHRSADALQLLKRSRPYWAFSVLGIITTQSDVVVAGAFLNTHATAMYAAAAKLSLALPVPLLAVNLILGPDIPRLVAAGRTDELQRRAQRLAALTAGCLLPLAGAFLLAGGPVLGLVYPPEYRDAATLLAILTVGTYTLAVTGSNGYVLLMTSDARFVAQSTAIVAIFQVAAMVVAAEWFGVVGLAVASTGGTVALNLTFTTRLWRAHRMRVDALSRVVGQRGLFGRHFESRGSHARRR